MDHEKSRYRRDESGVVRYSENENGSVANLQQRTAVGRHKDGSVYLRATDADDLAKVKAAADAMGVSYRQRRGGASHFGRVGSYEHLHFDHPADAAGVHAALGYHLEENGDAADHDSHLTKLSGGLKHHVQGKDARVDACMVNTRHAHQLSQDAAKADTPEAHRSAAQLHRLSAEAHRAQAARPWTKGEGSHHAGMAILHESISRQHGEMAVKAHKRIQAELKRKAELKRQLEAKEEGREVKKGHVDGDSYVMPLDEAVSEHEELVATLESPSRKDDAEAIQEQGAELEKMREARKNLGTAGAGTDLSTLSGGGALRAENHDEEISDATIGREVQKAAGKAKAGGEVGKNGEHYKGGQFLPSTTNPKESHSGAKGGGGKHEVAPYAWEHAPSPEHRTVWGRIKTFVDHAHLKATGIARVHPMFNADHPAVKTMSHGMDDINDKVERFNKGERWFQKALADEIIQAPTEAQMKAGNYPMQHHRVHGLGVSIENPIGSTRKGVAKDGTAWETTMKHHYGYIKRTEGADCDHVDCFLGPEPENPYVHVVNQIEPTTGKFDEHKVMIGFGSRQEAIDAYHANYQKGWKGFGDCKTLHVDDFKHWLKHGDTTSRLIYKAASTRLHTIARVQMQHLRCHPGARMSCGFTDAVDAAKGAGLSNAEILRTVSNATGAFAPLLKHLKDHA